MNILKQEKIDTAQSKEIADDLISEFIENATYPSFDFAKFLTDEDIVRVTDAILLSKE